MGKVSFQRTDNGSWIVFEDGDRLGFVRCLERGKWVATDTYLVGLRSRMKSRDTAVKALQRHMARISATAVPEL